MSLLGSRGRRLENRTQGGKSESYVQATISGTPLEVWIYDDEAQLQGPDIDERFEAADFRNAEALRRAFLMRAIELLERGWSAV